MPDDQNTIQNQDSAKNSIPPSPQEPMADVPIPATVSESVTMPPEASESPINVDNAVPVNNVNPENEPILAEKPKEITPLEPIDTPANPVSNEINNPPIEQNPEPVSNPVQTSEPSTAQMVGNEPLSPEPEPIDQAHDEPIKQEPVSSTSSSEVKQEVKPEPVSRAEATPPPSVPEPEKIIPVVPVVVAVSNKNKIVELLAKAKNAIQFRKRKKLDKIMTMFLKKSKITNDEVEKFLHVSDATATRYLSQLKKEGKIKQVGKTGHAVSYSRI